MLDRRTFIQGAAAAALVPVHRCLAAESWPRRSGRIPVACGRRLSYTEYGPADGEPVLHFHGIPSSRIEGAIFEAGAHKLRRRIITIERPGIGYSDYQCARTVLDWPADVDSFATALLGRQRSFSILAASGGTPYALACLNCTKIAERLESVAIVAGRAPPCAAAPGTWDPYLQLARRCPRLIALGIVVLRRRLCRNPDRWVGKMMADLPEPDAAIFATCRSRREFARDFQDMTRQGPRGLVTDMALLVGPWGFRLDRIEATVPVYLWHGKLDSIAPFSHAEYLAASLRIPPSRFTVDEDEGHISILYQRAEDAVVWQGQPGAA